MKTEVLAEAAGLAPGQSVSSLVCPKCGGGRSKEASFGVTRVESGVLYNCHRDSCGFRGFIPTAPWASEYNEVKPKKKIKPYSKSTAALGPEVLEFLNNRFELNEEVISKAGWRLGLDDGRVIMPVRNRRGYDIGVTARSYDPKITKKSIAYPNGNDEPWMAWYNFRGGKTVVLVEDQVSAVKIAQFAPSVALLGTGLNDEKVVELASSFANVILWLDADAIATAFSHQKKYKLMFGNFYVFSGSKTDPKDTSIEVIKSILSNYKVV